MKKLLSLALLASSALFATSASAGDQAAFYIGDYDYIQEDDEAVQLGGEYRWESLGYGFRPLAGANVNTDGDVYAYGGFMFDLKLGPVYLAPNFAPGIFVRGDGKELGHVIEFRSGIEAGISLGEGDDDHRLGIAVNHVSNAELGSKNPGAETALLIYSHPL